MIRVQALKNALYLFPSTYANYNSTLEFLPKAPPLILPSNLYEATHSNSLVSGIPSLIPLPLPNLLAHAHSQPP